MMKRARALTRRAYTLIELLVSLALGVILIAIMVFVWDTSQRIVADTTDKVEIYQRLRSILDIFERDIANVVRTHDMEFFVDKSGNRHYDLVTTPGSEEEFPQAVRGADWFYQDPNASNISGALPDGLPANLNGVPYFYAPVLYSPTEYPNVPEFDIDPTDTHRRDEFYFRSFSLINGESQPVMIHYSLRLSPTNPERPTLMRRISYVNRSTGAPQIVRREDELADGVCDLEFAMFYKESRIFDRGQFLDGRQARSIDTTVTPNRPIIPGLEAQFNSAAVSLFYSGSGIIERTREYGVIMRPIDADNAFQYGAVRPGDKVFLFDAEDDHNRTNPPYGDDTSTADEPLLKARFGQREFTIEQLIALQTTAGPVVLGANDSRIFIKFAEEIDFQNLTAPLLGEPPENNKDAGTGYERDVYQDFRVGYRIGFLPGAFRVRFKYRDFRKRRIIPFERVVRVLGS